MQGLDPADAACDETGERFARPARYSVGTARHERPPVPSPQPDVDGRRPRR